MLILAALGFTPEKSFKKYLPELLPGGGDPTQNGPKSGQDGPKTTPRAVHTIF